MECYGLRVKFVAAPLVVLGFGLVAAAAQAQAPQRAPKDARPAPQLAPAEPSLTEQILRKGVEDASVILADKACSGVVVGDTRHVATAAHCLPGRLDIIEVRHRSLGKRTGKLVYRDNGRDLALLELDEPLEVNPLELSSRIPAHGETLYFAGRIDRFRLGSRLQRAKVERIDRCPSLPEMRDALFTSLNARPGDSGAPLLDAHGRVLALVHGGARCHIAVPTYPLVAALQNGEPPVAAQSPPKATKQKPVSSEASGGKPERIGPFLVERTPEGYRFRWSFSWQTPK